MDPQKIVANVVNWVQHALEKQIAGEIIFDGLNVYNIAAEICGVHRTTPLKCVQKIGKAPAEKRKRGRKPLVIDDFDQKALSRLVLSFYTRSPPQLPTLDLITEEAKEIPGFPQVSRSTIRKILMSQGFVYKQRSKKMNVFQREDIVAHRHRYLHAIQKYRDEGFQIYYQDETWVNANHTREYIWKYQDQLLKGLEAEYGAAIQNGLKVPCGSGKRLIVNHIGSSAGFVNNCQMVFKGEKGTADYHGEMNHFVFEEWWMTKVLPNVCNRSVIVIDNASYHSRTTDDSKRPTTAWKKAKLQEWLREKGISFKDKDTKPILMKLAHNVFVEKKYCLEEMTSKFCKDNKKEIHVLRLPVGHSDLNPIELIWAKVKNWIASKNVKFNLTAVRELTEKALADVTASDWQGCISNAKKVESDFRKADGAAETHTAEPLIICLSEADFESEDEDDDDHEYLVGYEDEDEEEAVNKIARGHED